MCKRGVIMHVNAGFYTRSNTFGGPGVPGSFENLMKTVDLFSREKMHVRTYTYTHHNFARNLMNALTFIHGNPEG